MKKIKKLIILFVLLFTLQVNATDWYVAKTGNDANDGSSWQEAKLTISAMVTASSNGDTIYIGTGDYDETVNLDTANKSITLDGVDKTACIVRTGSGEKGIVIEDNTTIKNLTISTTSKTTGSMGVYGYGKNNLALEDCDITGADIGLDLGQCYNYFINNCDVVGYYIAIYFGLIYDNNIINNSTFYSDGSYSVGTGARTLYSGLGSGSVTFNNCTIQAVQDKTSVQSLHAVYANTDARIIFNNCSIAASAGLNDTGDVSGIYNRNVSGKITINNCIITTSTDGSGNVYDLYNYLSRGMLYIVDSSYDRSKVHGKIFEGSRCRRRYDLLGSSVR